ncbi:MAG: aryl-alcohol dehydrogenase-like predicted oxidoreductase [Paracoccaceae bacterium]|jgi:aryl-alcohol dehydrogenase-like predicted oxidoreductase
MTNMTSPDGTRASAFCFGTMQFGAKADDAAAAAMFADCRAAGVNFFDTAYMYTGGASETMLGALVAQEREALIVATKAAYDMPANRANILGSFETSRTRLGVEMIDLFYMHRWDDTTPIEETFETLAGLQSAGKIRYIGVSNYAAWQVMKAQSVAKSLGTRIDCFQPMYSLVKRQAEVEILPMAMDQGIAIVPYSPLGGGLLTGKYVGGAGSGRLVEDDRYAARYGLPEFHDAAARLVAIAQREGHDPATLACAWAARHPGVTAPILSAKSAEQLAPSLAALTYSMTDALYAELSTLVATPPPATDRLEEA